MSKSVQKTCENCGSIRDVNDAFCGNCGKTLNLLGHEENDPSVTLPAYPDMRPQVPSTPRLDNIGLSVNTPQLTLRTQSNRVYPVIIAVLVTMLIGIGSLELLQLVKGNQQDNLSNMLIPSNHSGTIPTNTARVSTTLSPTLGCPTSGGYFKIVNLNSSLVLEVPNGSLTSAVIQQYAYDGRPNQQWQFVSVGEGYFKIVNVNSDQVLDVPNASQNSNITIQQYSYNAGLGQQWQCIIVSRDHFKIVNANSGLVLDVPNTASHALLLQDHYNGRPNQQWQFVSVGEGYFKIVNLNSSLVLEVPNGSLTSAVIQQYAYDGRPNQQWQCIPAGEGYFKIVNVNSDQVLDVPNASQNSNVSVQQYSYNAGLGQQWQFVSSN